MCKETNPRTVSPTPRQVGDDPAYHWEAFRNEAHPEHLVARKRSLSQGTISTDNSFREVDETFSPSLFDPTIATITGYYKNVYDHYDVKSTIGKGHYGSVREASKKHAPWERCAIKSIHKGGEQSAGQLRREITLSQTANHPSIMKILDVCEDADCIHIVTEKYSGGELYDKIVERGTTGMPEAEAARIIFSLLSAVEHLHSKDIVHRDIKPENVMFVSTEKGSAIKLIDFGLARKHNSRQDPPIVNPVGSAYYMSPEVLHHRYDRSCDLWSIGIVAYILLCGYPPFNGYSDAEIFSSILTGELIFEPDRWDGVSEEAKDFVRCLLNRDSHLRPPAELALLHPWFLCQKGTL